MSTVKKLISDAFKLTQKNSGSSTAIVSEDGVTATMRTAFKSTGKSYTLTADVETKPTAKSRWISALTTRP